MFGSRTASFCLTFALGLVSSLAVGAVQDVDTQIELAKKKVENSPQMAVPRLNLGELLLKRADLGQYLDDFNQAADCFDVAATIASEQSPPNLEYLMRAQRGFEQLTLNILRLSSELPQDVQAQLLPIYFQSADRTWRQMRINAVVGEETSSLPSERRFADDIKAFEDQLRGVGFDGSCAAMGRLYLAEYQYLRQRFEAAWETLDGVADAVSDLKIRGDLQGMYWNVRGLLATEKSQFALAYRCHDRAREIRAGLRKQAMNDDAIMLANREVAESLNNMAMLLGQIGDQQAAESYLKAADSIYESDPDLYREAQHKTRLNRATILQNSGQYAKAGEDLEKLLTELERDFPHRSELLINCRNNFALNHYNRGLFDESAKLFRANRSEALGQWGEGHTRVAETDVNLAWVALAQRDLELAEQLFRDALAALLANDRENEKRISEVNGYLARVLAMRSQTEAAREELAKAVSRREQYLQRTLSSALSQRDQLAFVQDLRRHAESMSWPGTFDTFIELAPALKISAKQQYAHVITWKGVLSSRKAALRAADSEQREVAKIAAQREQAHSELRYLNARVTLETTQPDKLAEMTKRIAELESQINALDRQIRQQISDQPDQQQPISPAEVAAALDNDCVLMDVVEFRRYVAHGQNEEVSEHRAYAVFLIHPTGEVQRVDVPEADELDSAIDRFVTAVYSRQPTSTDSVGVIQRLLRERLDKHLGQTKRLILAPEGAFHRLPLAALPGRSEEFWVQEIAFAMVPHARSLVAKQSASSTERHGWAAVGGVDYGTFDPAGPIHTHWEPLPGAKAEATEVHQLFQRNAAAGQASEDQPSPLDGQVTKLQVVEQLERRKFVHIATHGYFSRVRPGAVPEVARAGASDIDDDELRGQKSLDSPLGKVVRKVHGMNDGFRVYDLGAGLDSGLILAGANQVNNNLGDPLLTAAELGQLDLQGLELVVLSACETGLGHVSTGQGAIGMLAQLDQAGAQSVVSSLWKVHDKATLHLMKAFYGHFLEGDAAGDASAALRAAQRDMIATGGQYHHPYYWAAWTVMGSTAPTPTPAAGRRQPSCSRRSLWPLRSSRTGVRRNGY